MGMNIRKLWDIKQTEINKELLNSSYNNKVIAQLLMNRGINTKEKAEMFLNPMKIKMSAPDVFNDMQKASYRIKSAIDKGENITVYGDFDADGITSTAIIYLTLKKIGAKVDFYLPDRDSESHGLNNKAIINIISKRKTKLIITVDCGVSNCSEVHLAEGLGTDVIITDHHETPENIPEAYAILNPKIPNSLKEDLRLDEIESLNNLSGAGVAFKLACKLLQMYSKEDFVYEIIPLAAVGTIGDVVPLLGENRRLVKMGLDLIKQGKCLGIKKLLKSAEFDNLDSVTSEIIAYYVVPRINSSGRLDSPVTALKVLISENNEEIDEAVKLLNDYNALRQELCDSTFSEAKSMYEKNINDNKKSIILFGENWHVGVIGIVCSKLVENYNKPAFLMTRDSLNPDKIRCSCRSIEGINIHSILSVHKEVFDNFGGHKMAAGFSFDENKISFDEFKKMLSQTIEENSQNIDFKTVKIHADMELESEDLNIETVELLNLLEPYGAMNSVPLFVLKNLKINNFKMMGQNNNHLKLFVSKNNSDIFECIKWNCTNFNPPVNSDIDILFSPRINLFNDRKLLQLIINDIHSDTIREQKYEYKILDHRNKKNILMQVLDFLNDTKKSTGVFIQNSELKKQLKLDEEVCEKVFNMKNIPLNIEQLMFFDCPLNQSDLSEIMEKTDAKIIHLMNFNISEIRIETFILKLSGMIKYCMSKMKNIFDIDRAANALNTDSDTIECSMTLFENTGMIEFEKTDDNKCIISSMKPIEMSKIKQDDMYGELYQRINNINKFRKFYVNSSLEEIKEIII